MTLKRRRANRLAVLLLASLITACQTTPPPRQGLTEEQIAVLRQEGFVLNEDGWELGLLSKLLFGNNSDTVSELMKPQIMRIARALLDVGIDRLRLEGHTDSYGTPEYNRDLSLRRAKSVAAVLVEAGMQEDRLVVIGRGMDRPVADNSTASGRQQNRRVSIIVPVP